MYFRKLRYVAFALAIAGMGWWIDNPYYQQMATFTAINTLLALSLNILMGYAGQISLGHAAFYGLGAYSTAILTTRLALSPWVALPCALLLAMIVAFLIGLPTLKLSGFYLGMGTLGFGMIVNILFREWTSLTGGASGFVGIPPLTVGEYVFYGGRAYLYLVWGVVLISFMLSDRLIDSRTGRARRAINDCEHAAQAVGVDTQRHKLQVFILSAALAALAGFFYAHLVSFISPGSFDFMMSVRIVTMVIIGGMATVWGAVLGAFVLTFLPEWLHAFSDYEMIVYGLVLMVVIIVLPQGLTRGIMELYERSKNR